MNRLVVSAIVSVLSGDWVNVREEDEFIPTTREEVVSEAVEANGKHNITRTKEGFIISKVATKSRPIDTAIVDKLYETVSSLLDEALVRAKEDQAKRQEAINEGVRKFEEMFGKEFAAAIQVGVAQIIPPIELEKEGWVWVKAKFNDTELEAQVRKLVSSIGVNSELKHKK